MPHYRHQPVSVLSYCRTHPVRRAGRLARDLAKEREARRGERRARILLVAEPIGRVAPSTQQYFAITVVIIVSAAAAAAALLLSGDVVCGENEKITIIGVGVVVLKFVMKKSQSIGAGPRATHTPHPYSLACTSPHET